jgi:hypothetical protein
LIYIAIKLGRSYLREKHRLKMSENRGLRRILGPRRDDEARNWGRVHIGKLH